MDRNYDLFEILPDGSPIWKCAVAGHHNAVQQLRELARHTANELRIMHLSTNTIIAVLNAPHQRDGANPPPSNPPAKNPLKFSAAQRVSFPSNLELFNVGDVGSSGPSRPLHGRDDLRPCPSSFVPPARPEERRASRRLF